MSKVEYILNHTDRDDGYASIYKCKITGLHFSWEDSEMHFNYLIRKKLINNDQ